MVANQLQMGAVGKGADLENYEAFWGEVRVGVSWQLEDFGKLAP
jgi:hypothetical protein